MKIDVAYAEVIMFTAGLEDYACPIANRLQQQYSAFKHRLYRPATVGSPSYPCIKDLSRLGRDLKRTVLVDDTPLAFLNQPDNGIPILGFRCAANFLIRVLGYAESCGHIHALQRSIIHSLPS